MAAGVGACLLFFAALAVWNIVAEELARKQNPVPGGFYVVDGKQMHMVCTGTGSPVVVLESAASARWKQWRKVQPELSRVTRVCSYDRAGHGWSEPRAGKRDAETIVRELHALLDQAGVKRPFVYASESAGGLYVREYAREYPGEIAGVALIESSSPRQIDELPGFRASWEQDARDYQSALWKDRLRVWSGWERLLGHCTNPSFDIDCRPPYVDMDEDELPWFEETSLEAGRLKSFGNVPLLIITGEKEIQPGPTAADGAKHAIWDREQEESKSLSAQSWRVIARESGHIVPIDRPDLVIGEITRLVDYVRGGPAAAFGTTTLN